MPRPCRALALGATAAIALFTLGFKGEAESNAVSPPPAAGAPLTVTDVRVRTTATGVPFSVHPFKIDGTSDVNTIAVTYKVTPHRAMPPGAHMSTRTVCRVGDRTLASDAAVFGPGLSSLPLNVPSERSFTRAPLGLAPTLPKACEIQFRWSAPAPGSPPSTAQAVDLGTLCWDGTRLAVGPCSPALLPRRPPGGPAVGRVERLDARFAPSKNPSKPGSVLHASFAMTANQRFVGEQRMVLRALCDGAAKEGVSPVFGSLRDLQPGESLGGNAMLFGLEPLATEPSKCTLRVQAESGPAPTATAVELGAFCLQGGKVGGGACP